MLDFRDAAHQARGRIFFGPEAHAVALNDVAFRRHKAGTGRQIRPHFKGRRKIGSCEARPKP